MKINAIGHLVKANPIQSQFKPNLLKAKMNVNLTLTKDYRKNDCLAPQKQTQFKPNFERPK